ncbi:MAG: S-layer homology domain-containing protein, partial [Veillonella caviae]|nr:S-layer homology domain-containing protein [Veillonella caviae]
EPQGSIISIIPTDDTSALIITADTVQNNTIKDFKNKFGKKVILQLPQQEMPKTTIQFPLPLKASK